MDWIQTYKKKLGRIKNDQKLLIIISLLFLLAFFNPEGLINLLYRKNLQGKQKNKC